MNNLIGKGIMIGIGISVIICGAKGKGKFQHAVTIGHIWLVGGILL
jgi:hypothetical protein